MSGKTVKIDNFDKKEEQQKDYGPDKNQKSEKIIKNEEKLEKMNAEKNNKAEKVDKPEKTNKDEKKEEKGVKGTAKSPTGNGSKTLASPDSKSKVGHIQTHIKRIISVIYAHFQHANCTVIVVKAVTR